MVLNKVTQGRKFVFTLHVADEGDIPPTLDFEKDQVRFLIAQLEKAPSTGKRHWQGYIEFTSAKRLAGVKAALKSTTVHIENAMGDAASNVRYCSKQESRAYPDREPFVFGEPSVACVARKKDQGLKSIADALDEGASQTDLIDMFPATMIQYRKQVKGYITEKRHREMGSDRPVYVEVRWGCTGTGKTQSVFRDDYAGTGVATSICAKFTPPLQCWSKPKVFTKRGLAEWFDGYEGEPVLLLDDFYPTTRTDADFLLSVLDKYYCRVNVKGDTVMAEWRHVVLTCNVSPELWFKVNDQLQIPFEKYKAVLNRLHRITFFEGDSHRQDAANVPEPYIEEDDVEEMPTIDLSTAMEIPGSIPTDEFSRSHSTVVEEVIPMTPPAEGPHDMEDLLRRFGIIEGELFHDETD